MQIVKLHIIIKIRTLYSNNAFALQNQIHFIICFISQEWLQKRTSNSEDPVQTNIHLKFQSMTMNTAIQTFHKISWLWWWQKDQKFIVFMFWLHKPQLWPWPYFHTRLAHDDPPPHQVWLQKIEWFRRGFKKKIL